MEGGGGGAEKVGINSCYSLHGNKRIESVLRVCPIKLDGLVDYIRFIRQSLSLNSETSSLNFSSLKV